MLMPMPMPQAQAQRSNVWRRMGPQRSGCAVLVLAQTPCAQVPQRWPVWQLT
jgi:hypothetical protein